MRLRVLVVLSMLVGTPSAADQLADAKTCSTMTDSLQRLTCFDRIFPPGTAPPLAEAPNPTSSSSWEITRERSAIDDSPKVIAVLRPSDTTEIGILAGRVALLFRCIENTTSVLISTGSFMADAPQVTIRFDANPARTTRWDVSSNYQAVGLWSGGEAIPFLKQIRNGQKMVVRVQGRERTDATFELGTAEPLIDEIAKACNWSRM